MGGQSGGEGGILRRWIPQPFKAPCDPPQALLLARIASLRMVPVVCGCLAILGIVISTFSAHPLLFPPVQNVAGCRCHSQRRRDTTGGSDPAPMVAAMYARYSSELQDEKSIEDQERMGNGRALKDGFPMPTEHMFSDHAVSGTKLHRKGLDAMLAFAKKRDFQVLYFYSLSRLARESVISMPMMKELVYVHQVRVISLTEGLDTIQPGWEIQAAFLSLHHEQFIKDLSANVHRGQVGTVIAKFSVGDYRFGYSSVPSPGGKMIGRGQNAKPRKVYVIHQVEAEWVRRIFHWYVVERQTLRWIVHELNRLNAPKDHRATTKKWQRAAVIGILCSPKYIGLWPWGLLKNDRNPLTGKITQVERPEEETSPWLREFPDLRLIDDATYDAAQKLLDKNKEDYARFRNAEGELRGSPKGRSQGHLLSNIVKCSCCSSKMYVGGSFGKYLFCPGARDGICACKSQLPRGLAEKMILEVIGDRMLANSIWREAVYQSLLSSWRQNLASRPSEGCEVRKLIEACDRRIQRLVDETEDSEEPDPGLRKRLQDRRAERNELAMRERQLEHPPAAMQTEPTREWCDNQLAKLGDVLKSATPAAGEALRNLLDGPIVIEEIPIPSRKRRFWRGTFVLRIARVAGAVVPAFSNESGVAADSEMMETITIDFRAKKKTEEQGDIAWPMMEQGFQCQEIAAKLGVTVARVTAIVRSAAEKRGVAFPDGRLRSASWEKKNQREEILQGEVLRLAEEGHSPEEISARMRINVVTVRQIVKIIGT